MLAVPTPGLIGTLAAPPATVAGPPLARLVAPLVTVTLMLAPLQLVGMLLSSTELAVPAETTKFGTTPLRLPHAVTDAAPAASDRDDGVVDRALTGPATVTTRALSATLIAR
jgi:hypothetical protein